MHYLEMLLHSKGWLRHKVRAEGRMASPHIHMGVALVNNKSLRTPLAWDLLRLLGTGTFQTVLGWKVRRKCRGLGLVCRLLMRTV